MKINVDEMTLDEVKKILEAYPDEPRNVRVFVDGFSCSGASFSLALDDKKDGDLVFDEGGVQFLIEQSLYDSYGEFQVVYVDQGFYVTPVNAPESGCSSCSSGSCSI